MIFPLKLFFFCKKIMLTYWTNVVFQRKLLGVAIDLVSNLKKKSSVCLFKIYCLIEQYCLVTCNFVSDKHTMITLSCLVSFASSFFFRGTNYYQLVLSDSLLSIQRNILWSTCVILSCLFLPCYIYLFF